MRAFNLFATILALAVLPSLATTAFAHHSWSSYDTGKPLKLTGTVTEVSYANPHATIRLEVEGKNWLAVLAPPARLSSRGLRSGEIKVGSKATVEGFPSREQAGEMRAERITLGGKAYELR